MPWKSLEFLFAGVVPGAEEPGPGDEVEAAAAADVSICSTSLQSVLKGYISHLRGQVDHITAEKIRQQAELTNTQDSVE